MACSSLPPANEVVGRLCFYRRVWFCSQWGVCSREGCLLRGDGVSAPERRCLLLGGLMGSAPKGDLHPGGSDGDPPIFFCTFFAFIWAFFCTFFAFFKFSFAFLPFFHTMGQWAGGTHPTGMHSCFSNFYHLQWEGVALGRGVWGSEGIYRG